MADYPGLQALVISYEQVQRLRIQTGERVRAVLQGRVRTVPKARGDAAELMERIEKGELIAGSGPLADLYAALRDQEASLLRSVTEALATHPAWPWLTEVKGVGPSLAGKLLSRLDVRRAETPSAFWAFCGLATVPAVAYECGICGFRREVAETQALVGDHTVPRSRKRCPGTARRVDDEGGAELRVAQPRPARGVKAAYSLQAKTLCYLLGVSFLRTRSPYADIYRVHKESLAFSKPGWTPRRRHLTAMRKCEKLFLAHLWLVWREAEGLPIVVPYQWSGTLADAKQAPWDFLKAPLAGMAR